MNGEKPSVNIKRSKIAEVFEYCLDNGISFQVQERAMGIDEFEVTMEVENIKKAIQLGFFLRENRIELAGANTTENKPVAKKPVVKKPVEAPAPNPLLSVPETKPEPKPEPKVETKVAPVIEPLETPVTEPNGDSVSLSFDLN